MLMNLCSGKRVNYMRYEEKYGWGYLHEKDM